MSGGGGGGGRVDLPTVGYHGSHKLNFLVPKSDIITLHNKKVGGLC